MDAHVQKSIDSVVSLLPKFRELDTTPERHIYLLWLVTRAVTILGGNRPILVGGGAVEFYTGVRFSTGDLDLVAPGSAICEEALCSLGFERPPNARHYINRTISALVEIHSDALQANEEPVEVVYQKTPLLIISPEDCLTERINKYKKHGSTLDLLNAFLIAFHQRDRINEETMVERMESKKLWKYYRPIEDISRALVLNEIGADEAAAELIRFMKEGKKECAF